MTVWVDRFHVTRAVLVSGLAEIGIVLALGTGLLLSTFQDCFCYGLPLPWRFDIVTLGGFGPGTIYSWLTFVLDVLFFVSVGFIIAISVMAYRRTIRGSRMKALAIFLWACATAYVTVITALFVQYAWLYYGSHTVPVL